MDGDIPVVAIDGPSGSGKGTIAQELAKRLRWHRLDSGALYRCIGQAALERGIPLSDEEALSDLTRRVELRFIADGNSEKVLLDGKDVTEAIRSEPVGRAASKVAALSAVRKALLERQRRCAVAPGLVADGRDMGTIVFPAAVLKVFLTASPEERARRRHKQLKEKGIGVSLRDLSQSIGDRDERDASRSIAPLKPAADAKVLDSTAMSPAEVIQQVLAWLESAGISATPRGA